MSYDVNLKCKCCNTYLFESNHTSNTAGIWNRHNFYFEDWHNKSARKMLPSFEDIITIMTKNGCEAYKEYINIHKWGTYETTLKWFFNIRQACLDNLDAIIEVDV